MEHLDLGAIDALLAGTAGEAERAHMGGCAECREAVGRLQAVARRLQEIPAPAIPAEVDRRILAQATLALRRPVGRRVWFAAAAALVMMGVVGWLASTPRKVDIVDAYRLALKIRDGAPGTQADIDAIAREAVSLKGGRR